MRRYLLVLCLTAAPAWGIDFKKYHSQAEIHDYLVGTAQSHPELVVFEKLGESDQGRALDFVTITRAPRLTAPAIYLNGTHHGNEKSSTEATLGVIEYLLAKRDQAPVKDWLDRYVFIVQPIVNADGHAANTREDAFGRDPNRDYAYPGKEDDDAFKSGFIRLVRDLLARFQVRGAIAYHSGQEAVWFPWCHTGGAAEQKDLYSSIAKEAAKAGGYRSYGQSYYDYPTNGEFVDYAYMKYGTIAVTFEVSSVANPPTGQLTKYVDRAVKGTLAFIDGVIAHDGGALVVAKAPRNPASFNPRYVKLGRRLE